MRNTSLEVWTSIVCFLAVWLLRPSYAFSPIRARPHRVLKRVISTSGVEAANLSISSGRAVIFDIDGTLCDSWNLGACP